MALKVLTANRLTDGEVVYLDTNAGWLPSLRAATIARDDAALDVLQEAGAASAARNEVVDVNLIDVMEDGETVRPMRLREFIRAAGPTTHPQFAR